MLIPTEQGAYYNDYAGKDHGAQMDQCEPEMCHRFLGYGATLSGQASGRNKCGAAAVAASRCCGGKLGAQFKSHSHGDFRAGTTLTQLLLHTGHEAAGAGCASVLGHRGCIRRRAIAGGELHQQLAATGLDGHRNIASLEAQPAAIELHQKRG